MSFTETQKDQIKKKLRSLLSAETEVTKIVIFGSFLNSDDPHDIDIAVFQNSNQKYIPLSMKYRRLTRQIAKILPVDIIPIKSSANNTFVNEVAIGEVIYER
ncbi:nucleotidyltransferase domain-containing protein [candidate division KSB1 bacterium]|nr:nucleotidyltransferase domain-containing protein [candidate division KSB1 bacterium]NIR72025.1 nucleotidyltransferase domain-containing protein [candidate division KSB1 bacterium]NIS26562.1 nucleotidyltransferase domain-containing protein [candidate division KSB1 bacterium]NIT73324.1 nucleotidyltransferase domain-containing protein [candidate division KSB1 bacterium]NIU27172.1 nucleotidyltransferase domain-containing protein [candidate division KSB1 bacterium]